MSHLDHLWGQVVHGSTKRSSEHVRGSAPRRGSHQKQKVFAIAHHGSLQQKGACSTYFRASSCNASETERFAFCFGRHTPSLSSAPSEVSNFQHVVVRDQQVLHMLTKHDRPCAWVANIETCVPSKPQWPLPRRATSNCCGKLGRQMATAISSWSNHHSFPEIKEPGRKTRKPELQETHRKLAARTQDRANPSLARAPPASSLCGRFGASGGTSARGPTERERQDTCRTATAIVTCARTLLMTATLSDTRAIYKRVSTLPKV